MAGTSILRMPAHADAFASLATRYSTIAGELQLELLRMAP